MLSNHTKFMHKMQTFAQENVIESESTEYKINRKTLILPSTITTKHLNNPNKQTI